METRSFKWTSRSTRFLFRDSLNYNPQSLAKWPATFGLENISKGTFPHKLNQPENWNLPGGMPYPELSDFDYDHIPEKDRASFLEWYNKDKLVKQGKYRVEEEMFAYCRMDVTVLRLCCEQFRNLNMAMSGGLCPFVSAVNIAGVCSVFWRTKFLEERQIAVMPHDGLNRLKSVITLQWMKWVARSRKIDIKHRFNRIKNKMGTFYVDGYCDDTNQVFEFYGCFHHGCPKCFSSETIHPFRNQSMKEVYDDTKARERFLESEGYEVITCWECEFKQESREDEDLREFMKSYVPSGPLVPRDAFYGGRTNGLKLYHSVAPDERIRYPDVLSEYP